MRARDYKYRNNNITFSFCPACADPDRPLVSRRHPGPDQRADGRCEAKGSDASRVRRRLYHEGRPRGRVRHGEVRVLRVLQVQQSERSFFTVKNKKKHLKKTYFDLG